MADIQMSDEDVYHKLCNLDCLVQMVGILKEAALELSKPLAVLFRKSPNDWKLADVAPVFKKGDRKLPSNYRPISLTPVICKVSD